MIVFDLQCAAGHPFEGWFDGLEDLESQLERGLVQCPVCADTTVRRVPSTFGISKSRGESGGEQAAMTLFKAFERHIKENYDDVGASFASEALKMHYGASEPRNIRGVSTPKEEEMLAKEGVSFFKLGPAREDDLPGSQPLDDDED